ncbi:CDP-diacylglycerol-serine O-phosphatidyltransferase [Rickettsiales bacterium Ac37b]|nr:CDP-diacylglycerol-serine O-phosphatidyltransferase [Rickettsiales bacterium Ac37b]
MIENDNLNTRDIHSTKMPIIRLFPNIVTLIGLCVGMTSIRLALDGKWENAVLFIVIAALIDGMDGRLARLLKASSNLGAQLDSLADFINFGVAPALVLYLWKLHNVPVKGLGWAVSLIYSMCCALRLARFNTTLEEAQPSWANNFFVGVPAPAGACLTLVPMMLNFQYDMVFQPVMLAVYVSIIAILMSSRIPTFSGKKISIAREFMSLILALVSLLIIGVIIEPWVILPVLGIIYGLSIPVSVIIFKRNSK